MKEFFRGSLPGGMPAETFAKLLSRKLEEFGLPNKKYGLIPEDVESFGEMGIIGKTDEDTGGILFTITHLRELERWGVLPDGFYKRFTKSRKKRL